MIHAAIKVDTLRIPPANHIELFVPAARINAIIKGNRAITADTALRLGKYFGTGPEFWINLQTNYDLCMAEKETEKELERIRAYSLA